MLITLYLATEGWQSEKITNVRYGLRHDTTAYNFEHKEKLI